MAGKGFRSIFGLLSLILLAGSIVLMFFVVLSGLTNTTPLKSTYFLRADTSSIPGSPRPVSQWTYFYTCGEGNTDCGAAVPALPFGAAWVGGSEGAPEPLTGPFYKDTTSKYYYYLWRFGWVFYLLALVFAVLAFFMSLLAPFSRLASGFGGFVTGVALFWMSLAASLMTTTFVKARDEFRNAGMDASIGKYAFGFTWGAWAAMFLAVVFLFLNVVASRDQTTRSTKKGFFGRKQNRRSARGSFIDNDSQRRVKDEYA